MASPWCWSWPQLPGLLPGTLQAYAMATASGFGGLRARIAWSPCAFCACAGIPQTGPLGSDSFLSIPGGPVSRNQASASAGSAAGAQPGQRLVVHDVRRVDALS